jgi:hypothetical protein
LEFLRRLFGTRIAEDGPQWDTGAREEDILCLALSRKYGGRCFAGLRLSDGSWVRPVSRAPEGTLFDAHFRLEDGEAPRILEAVRVPLSMARPEPNQPENWTIGRGIWRRLPTPAEEKLRSLLAQALSDTPLLFGTSGDRVAMEDYASHPAEASLSLIRPLYPVFMLMRNYGGRPQVRLRFSHSRNWYRLVVTDPEVEARLEGRTEGDYRPEDIGMVGTRLLATISLGEPFEGYCYKLVAAVFEEPNS